MPTDYPRCFPTIVGLSPSRMKTLRQEDVMALCEAFRQLTGCNPLGPVLIAEAWRNFQLKTMPERAGARAAEDSAPTS